MEQSAIPVIVLSGFLGSGKTTLLLRLLQQARADGLRASVLMNEIGAVDVDGAQISSESTYQMLERVTEGCLCCSKRSELAHCMERLALMRPDVIVMELTGVANPEEIVEAMTEPSIIGKVALHRIVTVLDAEHALDYNSIFSSDRELIRTLRRQIEVADVLVANKFDLISNRTADKVRGLVRDRNPAAELVCAVRCEIDADIVFRGIAASQTRRQPAISGLRTGALGIRHAGTSSTGRIANASNATSGQQASGNQAASVVSVSTAVDGRTPPIAAEIKSTGTSASARIGSDSAKSKSSGSPAATAEESRSAASGSFSRIRTAAIYPGPEAAGMTRRQFEAFIGGRGNNCLRAKGYMPFDRNGKLMMFQLAGKRLEWSAANYEGEPYFVMIGIDLDEEKIRREWSRLAARN